MSAHPACPVGIQHIREDVVIAPVLLDDFAAACTLLSEEGRTTFVASVSARVALA